MMVYGRSGAIAFLTCLIAQITASEGSDAAPDAAQRACATAAFEEYNRANTALLLQANPLMTTESTVAQRRLGQTRPRLDERPQWIEEANAAINERDYAKALNIVMPQAIQGDPYAQFRLAEMYSAGIGVPQDDTEAARWYRLAAEQGYARAQFELGRAYYIGTGVQPDSTQAAKWYRLAAERGDAKAQSALGFLYSFGFGVPKDYKEAAKWFRLGAEQGNAEAQAYLAGNYLLGLGVPQDFVAAYMWLNLAVARGLVGMADKRDEIARRLTPAQLAEAQKRAAEWRPKTTNTTRRAVSPKALPVRSRP
jgi:uncharacterized protein